MGKIEDLEKLQHLKESGSLTDEEFEKEKRVILSETSQNASNKVNKSKMKLWQIVVMIILIIVARICNICYWRGSYKQL